MFAIAFTTKQTRFEIFAIRTTAGNTIEDINYDTTGKTNARVISTP
jgi:hypothetical protein